MPTARLVTSQYSAQLTSLSLVGRLKHMRKGCRSTCSATFNAITKSLNKIWRAVRKACVSIIAWGESHSRSDELEELRECKLVYEKVQVSFFLQNSLFISIIFLFLEGSCEDLRFKSLCKEQSFDVFECIFSLIFYAVDLLRYLRVLVCVFSIIWIKIFFIFFNK